MSGFLQFLLSLVLKFALAVLAIAFAVVVIVIALLVVIFVLIKALITGQTSVPAELLSRFRQRRAQGIFSGSIARAPNPTAQIVEVEVRDVSDRLGTRTGTPTVSRPSRRSSSDSVTDVAVKPQSAVKE